MLWVPLERNDLASTHPLEQRLKKLQCATRDARSVYDGSTLMPRRGMTGTRRAERLETERD